jgi:hypothetical protein
MVVGLQLPVQSVPITTKVVSLAANYPMFKELATLETYGFVYISSEGQKVCLYCVYVEME